MPRPVFVIALPRSRTAWLANFFYYSRYCVALHEPLAGLQGGVGSLCDFIAKLDVENVVVCDTALPVFIDDIMKRAGRDDPRFVVVLKDHNDVRKSLRAIGIYSDNFDRVVHAYKRAIERVLESPYSQFVIDADAIDSEHAMTLLWRFVNGAVPFPLFRYQMLRDMNVQSMIGRIEERVRNNSPMIEALRRHLET